MKSYMASHGPRAVPIGYSAADDLSFRTSLPKYLQCDDGTGDSSIDFYGVNSYQCMLKLMSLYNHDVNVSS